MLALILAAAIVSEPQIDWQNTPVFAAQVAAADIQTLPPDVATRTRYLFLRGGTTTELAVSSFVANSVLSRVNVGITPGSSPAMVPLAGGKVVRLDLGLFATNPGDLLNLVNTWEKFTLVERDFTVKSVIAKKVEVPKFKAKDGKWYTFKIQDVSVRIAAPYVNEPVGVLLQATGSEVPIIDAREFIRTGFGTVEGGLYYDFRGITGKTLKQYLASRGASEEQVAGLESIEKLAVLQSKVTGKERQIALFRGAGVRASVGGGLVSLTFDVFDEDREEGSAIRNLLTFRGKGSEVIVEMASGFHEFSLWNAQGQLVKVAPPNLAIDHTVPEPYTNNLYPGLSCVVCHAQEYGWRTANNDIKRLIDSGTNVLGDLTSTDDPIKQAQVLAGLYLGPSWFEVGTGPFAVGRLTYSKAVLRATGKTSQEMATTVGQFRDAYMYTALDIWAVAKEIGIQGIPPSDGNPDTEDDLQAALAFCRPILGAQGNPGEIVSEDGVAAAILAGIPVPRRSFDTVKGLLMARAYGRIQK